jgi:hypothetical protein
MNATDTETDEQSGVTLSAYAVARPLAMPARVRYGRQWLELPADVLDSEIHQVATCLRAVESSFNWLLGDLLQQVGQLRGGLRADELMAAFGAGERTAYDARMVCANFGRAGRMEGLSFSHHLCALTETGSAPGSTHWLALAQQGGWSVAQLRTAIRAQSRAPAPPGHARQFAPIYQAAAACRRLPVAELSPSDIESLREDTRELHAWLGELHKEAR